MAKKIYLADDEQDIREILTEFLSNAGYEVTAYKNGDTLFSAFQEKPCDLAMSLTLAKSRNRKYL